jgi:serine/threonine protein kinase
LTAPGHTPDVLNAALTPQLLLQDRYRIVRQLGKGGMGAVYEAVDERLEKTVALKETLSSEPPMRRQFEREARLLAGMQHRALPQVTDHFVEGNRAFLVMQFIEGVDLARIMSQQPGPFPRDQVIAWADQLLDALIYLHTRERQVIHRDIKPHNLKLTSGGQIALLDFGLAKAQAADHSGTASHSFFGYTRHYAPLEQIQDQCTDPRSDIYALGATLYHLLTGIKPPDAMVRATALLNHEPDPLQAADKIHAAVGPEVAAILNKAMAQKPEDRYASANEFREALSLTGRTIEVSLSVKRPHSTQAVTPTVHVSELTAVRRVNLTAPQMALVGSAKRFGPAGATVVLALVCMFVGGVLYASQRMFPDTVKIIPVVNSTTAASALRQNSNRKNEQRASDLVGTAAKPKSPGEKGNEVTARKSPSPANVVRTQIVTEREVTSGASRKSSPRVGAPSIRLPSPDIQ